MNPLDLINSAVALIPPHWPMAIWALLGGLTWKLVGLCLLVGFVLLAAICRINMINARKHRYSFVMMYLCLVLFAGGTLADCLTTGNYPSAWAICGLIAAAVNIINSRERWMLDVPWAARPKALREDRRQAERRNDSGMMQTAAERA